MVASPSAVRTRSSPSNRRLKPRPEHDSTTRPNSWPNATTPVLSDSSTLPKALKRSEDGLCRARLVANHASDAAGLAALTATVADLHESGLSHGNLRADHVLIDAEQRPILCGFGDGEPATEERIQRPCGTRTHASSLDPR